MQFHPTLVYNMIRCDIDGTRKKRRFTVNLSRDYIDSLYKKFIGTSHSYV